MNPSHDGMESTKTPMSERLREASSKARDLGQHAYGAIKSEPPWVLATIGGLFAALMGAVAALFVQHRRHQRKLTV